jgi:ankyrin repeat protein
LVVKNGNIKAAEMLLGRGAELDDPDVSSKPLLLISKTAPSVEYDQADLPGHQSLGTTALHAAAELGNLAMMKLLVEYTHDSTDFMNLTDDHQRTPLYFACCEKEGECALYLLSMLLKHDIKDVNRIAYNGKTPLRKAAFRDTPRLSSNYYNSMTSELL